MLAAVVVLAAAACDVSGGVETTGYTGGSDDCLANATAQGVNQARAVFPDYPEVEWSTTARTTTSQGYADVELTPIPPEVGYPTFRFYSVCRGDDVALVAVFAQTRDDGWELLFTTDEGAGIDFEVPTG